MVISFKVNTSAIENRLNAITKNLSDMQQFWHSVGLYLKKRTIKECFDKEQSPEGVKWQALSRKRINQRSKRHKGGIMKILQDTGELRRSVNFQAFKDKVIVGSNLKYARTHQLGRGNIPARPFLGVTEQDKKEIFSMLNQICSGKLTN